MPEIATVKTLEFTLAELQIDVNRVYRLMGFEAGNVHEPFPEMVQFELENLMEYCHVKGGYVIKEDMEAGKDQLRVDKTHFNVGRKVAHFLKSSTSFALFTCTAGSAISDRVHQHTLKGESIEAYVCDVLGSVIVETAMDKIHDYLRTECSLLGKTATNRYSPGYCDWSVAEQFKLFSFLPENFCGVSLNESALMDPIKSVSGIIGIGDATKFSEYMCDSCNCTNCIYRSKK